MSYSCTADGRDNFCLGGEVTNEDAHFAAQ